ncbi:O-antigen ligase family protein [Marinobacter zhejiangensis]|uniref:O-antigen ligase-related domain-containing protein n=1 Tax=Marinobacter zhejiangensis TaxID=488535 RepID=A0A1I4QQ16_9GAMM|nr:O-antigen ligase family protein [Marinobacter zhejiangensis]SFM41806.1 hypothetical protein SAMN04487963_2497 [Marinobacter zhejiangensis]
MILRAVDKKVSSVMERLFCFVPHLWCLVVGVSLFQLAQLLNIDAHNAQRIVQLGLFGFSLFIALLAVLCSDSAISNSPRFSNSNAGLLVVASMMTIVGIVGSLIGARFPVWALLDLEYLLMLLGGGWIIFLSLQKAALVHWRLLGGAVVIAMLLFSFRSFVEVLIASPFSNKLTATPAFTNIRTYANLAVIFIPLSCLALTGSPGVGRVFLVWLVNVFWVWVLVLTEARAALLALGVGVGWVALRYGRSGLVALAGALSVLFVSSLIYLLVPVLEADGWVRDITSSSGRWELWSLSWRYFVDSFPFGIGGMMFAADGRLAHASPHNVFFTLMAEWGALVVAGGVLFFSFLIQQSRRNPKGESPSAKVMIPVVWAVIAGFVNAQFSGAHIGSFSSMALILAFGAYSALRFPAHLSQKERPIRGLPTRLILIILFCIWGHASFLSYKLHIISEDRRGTCLELASGKLYPRIWVQGRLDCGL